ncbi:unnamed protein product [Closterium sp. NIES-53]
MASLRVLAFDHEGKPVAFDTWHDDLQLYLLSDIKDGVSLFDHVSGVARAPPTTADGSTRSQWLSRDATARLAIRNHLLVAECTHFGEHRTARALYDTVVARYSSPATAALGRLLLPYLFPELSAFPTVADLVTHLRTSDARYRATVPAEFLATNQPPMFITLYFIVSRLPDSLRSVRDHFLSLDPTSLTVDLLEQHLLAAETSAIADVGATSTSAKRRNSKARVAGMVEAAAMVVEVAVGAVVGAAVEVVEAVEVVTAVGLVATVGALVEAVEEAEGVAAVEAVGLVVAGLDLGVEALMVCEPPDLGVAAAALGASASGTPPSTAPAEALHTFTLDSCASCWSSLYTLATEPPQVAVFAQVFASDQVAASCSCRLLTHQTLMWHHCLGHPSLPHLRGMHSRFLVSSRPRSLPPLPPSPAPPCLPCVEGRQRAAPHSSSFPPTSAPLQTLHMDVWGLARVSGQGRERYFLLVVDDYTRYTTVFPLCSNGKVVDVLIPWICTVRLQLHERFDTDLPALRRHFVRGGEFSSNLLWDLCCGEGILHSFTLPASPHQNGIAEHRIGLVMEVARTSMIHAAAPHILWPFAVRYTVHQLNQWPCVSLPETLPTLRWTGKVGDALMFWFYHPSPRLSLQQLREWLVRRAHRRSGAPGAGAAGDTGARGYAVPAGAGGTRGAAATGPGGARTSGAGAAGTGGVGCAGARGPAGAGAVDPGARGAGGILQPSLQPGSPLPAPSPYNEQSGGLTERREPASCPLSRVRTARRAPRLRPPSVPGKHAMALRPSSVPLCVPLRAPPKSSLPEVPDPESYRARAASPTVSRLLATAVIYLSFESAAASALVAELLDFEDFECLAAAIPRFASMLLAPEGDPDAPDIPTPRTYAGAITGPYSSQWQAAMDAEMASWKSTGTYVDEFPPSQANIVDGMWIFRVKRPLGSPPAFKARHVAQGFSQRQGVDYFQTFSPTPKMTTLWVLLHVAAQRDYELHSVDFSTAILQGSLHEEIWLRRPPGFTGTFHAGTQWSLQRPIYGLRQAPREWNDTLRTTLAALGFAPSNADPSLFLRTDTSLPPFYVLVYVNDLVLQRFGFLFSSPQPTPLPTGHLLSAPPSDESVEPSGPYLELVGCLMYLVTCTRPDLAYPLSLLACYVAPGMHQKVHWDAAKRVLRYLCSTSGMGLVLGGRGPMVLTGHDIDHNTCTRYKKHRELHDKNDKFMHHRITTTLLT